MVEQIVYFVLGFVICGLIGLAFLPLVSARARRLTLARIEARLPMTFDEIEADRDLLRARFAVENRTLEVKAEQARDGRVAEDAELGRRAVAVMRLTEQLEKTTAMLSERNADLVKARDYGETTLVELNETRETLARTQAELAKLIADFAALSEERQRLGDRVKELEKGLASASAHLKEDRARMEASDAARKEIAERYEAASSQAKRLADDLAEAERRRADFDARRTRMLAKIATERKRSDDLEAANLDLRRQIVVLAGAAENAAKAGGDAASGVASVMSQEAELLDLREAISRLGRQIAHMEGAEE